MPTSNLRLSWLRSSAVSGHASTGVVNDDKMLASGADVGSDRRRYSGVVGGVMEDQLLRSDRRAHRADDKGDCKKTPVCKQRISTLRIRPLHPDCQEVL